jgi:hypothetical protein
MMIKDLEMRKDLAADELSAVRGGNGGNSIEQYGQQVYGNVENHGKAFGSPVLGFVYAEGNQNAKIVDIDKRTTYQAPSKRRYGRHGW